MNRENRQGTSAARKADEARLDALRGGLTTQTAYPVDFTSNKVFRDALEYFCVMLGISYALEGNGHAPTFSEAISHYPFIESENVYLAMLDGKPLQYLLDAEEGCEIARRFKLKQSV